MDYKTAAISCIERLPETEETERALKQIYSIAKKAGKEKRFAPKRSKAEGMLPDLRDEIGHIIVKNRMAR